MSNDNVSSLKRVKKFYLLSLFCLIPAFGIIVGIILIIYALFVFKNIKLLIVVLISLCGGIIIMELDKNYLKNELMHSKISDDNFSKFAIEHLDEIASRLEDYKMENRKYPDSLKQLKIRYPELIIIDPLLARNTMAPKEISYYYSRFGEKYILFSAGIDEIPNTKDDIFPRKPIKP